MGSLFHCLRVAWKMNGKGFDGLPLHVENAGLPAFWGLSVGGTLSSDSRHRSNLFLNIITCQEYVERCKKR